MSKGNEYSRRLVSLKIFLIGLITLLSCSLPILGRKKSPEMYSQPRLLTLSSEESKMIDSAYLQSGDRGKIAKHGRDWYKFEVHTLLKKIFPTVQFYKIESGITIPPTSYIMAYLNGKFYNLPFYFNRLALDNRLEVNDKNIIELAKAFVVIAFMVDPYIRYWKGKEYNITEVKEITFLERKRSVDKKKTPPIRRGYLKVRVDNEVQIYGFHIQHGQIQWATMNVEAKLIISTSTLKL